MSVNNDTDGEEQLTMAEAVDIVDEARQKYTDEYVVEVMEDVDGDIVDAALVFDRNSGADSDSGEGTFGMTDDLFERADVSGSPNVIEQTYTVKVPEDVDHHLVWRGSEDRLAAKMARRQFAEEYDIRPRGKRINPLKFNPGDGFRSIWIVTLSTQSDVTNESPEHHYRFYDRIVPADADDDEKPNWMTGD